MGLGALNSIRSMSMRAKGLSKDAAQAISSGKLPQSALDKKLFVSKIKEQAKQKGGDEFVKGKSKAMEAIGKVKGTADSTVDKATQKATGTAKILLGKLF